MALFRCRAFSFIVHRWKLVLWLHITLWATAEIIKWQKKYRCLVSGSIVFSTWQTHCIFFDTADYPTKPFDMQAILIWFKTLQHWILVLFKGKGRVGGKRIRKFARRQIWFQSQTTDVISEQSRIITTNCLSIFMQCITCATCACMTLTMLRHLQCKIMILQLLLQS